MTTLFDPLEYSLAHPQLNNVLRRRAASWEEQMAGRTCEECLRSTWTRESYSAGVGPYWGRCTLFANPASPREICDSFEGAPF